MKASFFNKRRNVQVCKSPQFLRVDAAIARYFLVVKVHGKGIRSLIGTGCVRFSKKKTKKLCIRRTRSVSSVSNHVFYDQFITLT